MVFAIHWHESAMDLHVFPIPIPPPTSLHTILKYRLEGLFLSITALQQTAFPCGAQQVSLDHPGLYPIYGYICAHHSLYPFYGCICAQSFRMVHGDIKGPSFCEWLKAICQRNLLCVVELNIYDRMSWTSRKMRSRYYAGPEVAGCFYLLDCRTPSPFGGQSPPSWGMSESSLKEVLFNLDGAPGSSGFIARAGFLVTPLGTLLGRLAGTTATAL